MARTRLIYIHVILPGGRKPKGIGDDAPSTCPSLVPAHYRGGRKPKGIGDSMLGFAFQRLPLYYRGAESRKALETA